MNRNLRLGTLITALLLVAAALYFGARPAHAICYCDPVQWFVTDCHAKGSTCDAAVLNLSAACQQAAHQACQSLGHAAACHISFVQNAPYYCWFDSGSGMWVVDGVVTFQCKTCEDIV